MQRGKLLRAGGLGAAALLIALAGLPGHLRRAAEERGPRTFEEVARIAAARSLCCRSDRPGGVHFTRLVVSRTPLSLEETNLLSFGDPTRPCWRGKVAVCYPRRQYLDHLEPGHAAVWGEMLLFGDPAVIEQLTGRRPGSERRAGAFWRGPWSGGDAGEPRSPPAPPAGARHPAPIQATTISE
jgi:hypothetical protein